MMACAAGCSSVGRDEMCPRMSVLGEMPSADLFALLEKEESFWVGGGEGRRKEGGRRKGRRRGGKGKEKGGRERDLIWLNM